MTTSTPTTPTLPVSAEAVVLAVRALGSDTTNLRDAAHEASHALELRVPRGKWSRVTIDRYAQRKKLGRGDISSEILARAVEQIVCERLGVPIASVDRLAAVAAMESNKLDRVSFDPDVFASMVRQMMSSKRAGEMADAVIALAKAPKSKQGRAARGVS